MSNLTKKATMKNLLLCAIIITSLMEANPKKTPTAQECISVNRRIACEVAYKKFMANASTVFDPEKNNIVINNNAEHQVYEAFEFIEKHCSDYVPPFLSEKESKQVV